MESDKRGVSTCEKGKENYEVFLSKAVRQYLIQYEYRDFDGELFTCVSRNLDQARRKKAVWLDNKKNKK